MSASVVMSEPAPHLFSLPSQEVMQRAYLASDASFDGVFFVAVKTTGIFCLPSCKARKPFKENVEFFASVKEALFAGYRPCLRCKPLELHTTPDWIARVLHAIDAEPTHKFTDQDLRLLDSDPVRVRRYFVKHFGLTFQAYCRGRRLSRALENIRKGGTLDDAVFEAGFNSHSGFRDSFTTTFGHPPGKIDAIDPVQLTWLDTPMGPMIAGAVQAGICLLEFTDRRMLETELNMLRKHFKTVTVPGETPHHTTLRKELEAYFARTLRTFQTKTIRFGTPFEERVWDQLDQIPYGTTVSYEGLARRIGSPGAVRAVGRANGMNKLGIIVPCHRVIRKCGDLAGYGGGIWRKRLLIDLESSG
jgi:AraC family transcriptional regulator of adaptative response/methylated-DNA-[protein]-cysteine methyltransferase